MPVDQLYTLSTVFSCLRDAALIWAVFKGVWGARGKYQDILNFAAAIRAHMTLMEAFALRVETNHLAHIEDYLKERRRDSNSI